MFESVDGNGYMELIDDLLIISGPVPYSSFRQTSKDPCLSNLGLIFTNGDVFSFYFLVICE